jgi:GNAT superfamily N-acetyltransferase
MTDRRIIHITGAAGTGTTTLGSALAKKLDYTHFDTDDFYWLPSEPPYQNKRPVEKRLALMNSAIESTKPKRCVISGSLDGWGDPLIPLFKLVVFLKVPTQIRISRLRDRETRRFGKEAISPGGVMYEEHEAFIAWAATYDEGTMEGRSLPRHQTYLRTLPCSVLCLDGTEALENLLEQISEKLAQPEISIRTAHPEDVPTILDVHCAAVHGTASAFYDQDILNDWSPAPVPPERIHDLTARIKSGEEIMLVAESPTGKIVGFGSIFPSQAELRAVYVHPNCGKQGLGGRLLKEVENLARESGLLELSMDASINAEKFYLSHGYQIVQRGEHVLRSGRRMACIKMKKILEKPNVAG